VTEDEIIEKYEYLVYYFVNRFRHYWHVSSAFDREDLEQVGSLQLLQAARRFDPTRGFEFSTYAGTYILGGLRHFLRDHLSPLRLHKEVPLSKRIGKIENLEKPVYDGEFTLMETIEGPAAEYGAVDLMVTLQRMFHKRDIKIFQLRMKGFSQREIGDRLGMRQVSVSRILRRSQRQLQAVMGGA
jgi:RNA polymerase sigma factor (sigma-70 family)